MNDQDLNRLLANIDAATVDASSSWSSEVAWNHALLILGFGFAVLLVMAYLLHKRTSHAVLRLCALPLTIIAAIYLVIVGYSPNQINPVLALLSAIAGYLLGNIGHRDGDETPGEVQPRRDQRDP